MKQAEDSVYTSFSWHALDERSFQINIKTPATDVGTLYRLTAAIYTLGLDIQQGQVQTIVDDSGQVYSEDNFLLQIRPGAENRKSSHPLINEVSARLGQLMETMLTVDFNIEEYLVNLNCKPPALQASMQDDFSLDFINHKDDAYTAMTLRTGDRPGLLFKIARVLTELGISIFQATILTTDQHKAEDHFYLKKDGGLPAVSDLEAIRSALG